MPSLRWLDNEVYGHAAILRAAAGVAKPYHFSRHVQHGWNPGSGWTLGGKELFPIRAPRAVWGDRQLDWYRHRGLPEPPAIGAPFLYLQNALALAESASTTGVVLFPYHGTAAHPVAYDRRDLIRTVRETESEPITICLHPSDFASESARSEYSDLGEVVTLGEKHDPYFLVRLTLLLRRNRRAITNRFSTAIVYAAYLQREVGIYGPTARISLETHEPEPDLGLEPLHVAQADPALAYSIAQRELGLTHLKSPEELRAILGLRSSHQLTRIPITLGASATFRLLKRMTP